MGVDGVVTAARGDDDDDSVCMGVSITNSWSLFSNDSFEPLPTDFMRVN